MSEEMHEIEAWADKIKIDLHQDGDRGYWTIVDGDDDGESGIAVLRDLLPPGWTANFTGAYHGDCPVVGIERPDEAA